ncbi:MAG: tetratricopeptide repeat protein [Verrucomicrobiota bacterium]
MAASLFVPSMVSSADGDLSDPSDVWLRAYMIMQEAEEKESQRRDLEALSKYREAQRLFDYIARTNPDWKSNMLSYRRKAILDKIDGLHQKMKNTDPQAAEKYRRSNPGVTQAPVTPATPPNGFSVPAERELRPSIGNSGAGAGSADGLGGEFQRLQAQMDQLSGENLRFKTQIQQSTQAISSLEDQLKKSRDVEQHLRGQLTQALDDLENAEAKGGKELEKVEQRLRLATNELRQANIESGNILQALEGAKAEVAELSRQKQALLSAREGEMERLSRVIAQLEQTEGDRDLARSERDAARTEIKRLKEELARSQVVMEAPAPDPNVAKQFEKVDAENSAVLKRLEEALAGNEELANRNSGLVAELKKSQETIGVLNDRVRELEADKRQLEQSNRQLLARQDELIEERDSLRQERDELAILLQNSGGDVGEVVKQSEKWRDELRKVGKRVRELEQNEAKYEGEIDELRSSLASMRAQREVLQAESENYKERVVTLNEKLNAMLGQLDEKTKALQKVADSGAAQPGQLQEMEEENELLRSLIRQRLVEAAKARSAKEMVIQELQKMDYQSELLLSNLDHLAPKPPTLTDDEKEIFRGTEELKMFELVETSSSAPESFASLAMNSRTLPRFPDGGMRTISEGSGGAISPQAQKEKITQLAKAANYDYTLGRLDLAEKGYRKILAMAPENVFAVANLGLIQIQRGEKGKARELLNQALELDEAHAPAHYYLGVLAYMQKDFEVALESFGNCVVNDRGNANAHNYIGLISTSKGWLARAESEFQSAVQLDPSHSVAHFNLAWLYYDRNVPDPHRVRKHYEKARSLGASVDPDIEQFLASR